MRVSKLIGFHRLHYPFGCFYHIYIQLLYIIIVVIFHLNNSKYSPLFHRTGVMYRLQIVNSNLLITSRSEKKIYTSVSSIR